MRKSPPNKKTKELEILVCEEYLKGVDVEEISFDHKLSITCIFKILKRNNIKLKRSRDFDLELKIISDFRDLSQTRDSILAKYNIGKTKLFRILRDHDEPKRPKKRKFFFNENFFNTIDSQEKAQILGLIYSDGCLNKNSNCSIFLHYKDKEYLEKIKNIINYKGELTLRDGRFSKKPNGKMGWSDAQYGLSLHSVKMYKDLINIGLCNRKSWANLGIPNILDKFKKSFILGILEGDGSINISKPWNGDGRKRVIGKIRINFTGNYNMMLDISKFIEQELQIVTKIERKNSSEFCYSINYSRVNDVLKLIKWLYNDASFYMERKFLKAQEILNLYSSH